MHRLYNAGLMVAVGLTAASAHAEDVVVQVDASQRRQTITGFGASHRSLVYEGAGDVLTAEQRLRALTALYRDIRVSTGPLESDLLESPAGYAERANDNADPRLINWRGFQPLTAVAAKRRVLELAVPMGFEGFYLAQKINSRWRSPWLSPLRRTQYDLFLEECAEQIVTGYTYWRDRLGVTSPYVMPFNEPVGGYDELDGATAMDLANIVKRAGRRLREAGFEKISFVVPNADTPARSMEQAAAILADPEARQYVGAIGYHAYPVRGAYAHIPTILTTSGAGRPVAQEVIARRHLRELAAQYKLPLWMTEVSNGGVDPRSFDALRGRAVHIHDELLHAGASAYCAMGTMWDRGSQQAHFGNRQLFGTEGDLVLIDQDADQVIITGTGHAIGHYARWVPPGSTRVEAFSDDLLVQASAFLDPRANRLVAVLINNAPKPLQVRIDVRGAQIASPLLGEQSTAAEAWKALGPTQIEPSELIVTLPTQSVTSLALPLGERPASPPIAFQAPEPAVIEDVGVEGDVSEEVVVSAAEEPMRSEEPAADLDQPMSTPLPSADALLGAPRSIPEQPLVSTPPRPGPPTKLWLRADRTTIAEGESVTLLWEAANAQRCQGFGGWAGQHPMVGSRDERPEKTTLYGLMCMGPSGPITRYLLITVNAAPAPAAHKPAGREATIGPATVGSLPSTADAVASPAPSSEAVLIAKPPAPTAPIATIEPVPPVVPEPPASMPAESPSAGEIETAAAVAIAVTDVAMTEGSEEPPVQHKAPVPAPSTERVVESPAEAPVAATPAEEEPSAPAGPTVVIKQPAPDTTVRAPARVAVSASASGARPITRLTISVGKTILNECAERTCHATFSTEQPAEYVLTAEAQDAAGDTGRSTVSVIVTP